MFCGGRVEASKVFVGGEVNAGHPQYPHPHRHRAINSYISPTSTLACGPRPRAGSWSLPIAFPGCFEAILSDRMLPQMLVIMSAQSEIVKISQNWANRENKNLFGPG